MTFFFRYELNGGGYCCFKDDNISELLVPAEQSVTELVPGIVASVFFFGHLKKLRKLRIAASNRLTF